MPNIDITDDTTNVYPDGGAVVVPDESTPDPSIDSDVDDDADREPDEYDETDTDDMGSGGDPIPPDSTPAVDILPDPTPVYREVQQAEYITDYSAAALAEYEDSGAAAWAVYDDGTEAQVAWSSVEDPSPAGANAANEAADVAEATNQHFWQRATDPNSDGAGTGAFVTDDEQDTFLAAAAAGFPDTSKPYHNLLMNSLGILLRTAIKNLVSITRSAVAFYDGLGNNASNITALFGADGFQVGSSSESRMVGDYHSLRLVDAEGGAYFHVSDLRNASGIATLTETFIAETIQTDFTVTLDIYDPSTVTATVNGSYVRCTVSGKTVSLQTAATWGSEVAITYTTQARNAKAYTLGIDRAGDIGPLSMMEGYANEASGHASHAEGRLNVASGSYAHAEGYESVASGWAAHAEGRSATASGWASSASGNHTTAAGNSQTVVGRYNVEDTQDAFAFIVGNGTNSTPSNALQVRWNGKTEVGALEASGTVTAQDIDASGTLDVGGNATVGGTLDVTGDTTAGGALDVTGTTNIYGDMNMYLDNGAATHLVLRDPRMDKSHDGVPTTGAQVERCIGTYDKNNGWVGRMTFRQEANGLKRSMLEAVGVNSGGTAVWNSLAVNVGADGARGYTVADPAAFCTALHVGDQVVKDQSTAVSMANSTYANICSISLAAGTWVIEATAQYAGNATGRRFAFISATSASSSSNDIRQTGANANAVTGGNSTFLHCGCTKVLTATTTIYLVGWQNSGGALSTYGCISAVRIK